MEGFVLPERRNLAELLNEPAKSVFSGKTEKTRHNKGQCWSEEEHLAFLKGLKKLGKGNWRGISRYYVPTRTSTQIASHAQKYAQRVSGVTKRTSKFSKIEQQANEAKSEGSAPSGEQQSNPSEPDMQSISVPADSEARCLKDDPAKLQEGVSPRKRAKQAGLRRPQAVRASESKPEMADLLKLAESLVSLGDPRNNLSPSGSSAFTPAPLATETLSCSPHEEPRGSGTNVSV